MKKRAKSLLPLLIGLSLLVSPRAPLLGQTLEEQTVLAALSLNIVRFTSWPEITQKQMRGVIEFCVVGDNVIQEAFADIDQKSVGNYTLRVINLTRLRNYETCQILYISGLKQNILLQVLAEIKKRPLLTIGEGSDFALQGGMVGLENVDGKFALHVNLKAVRESGLSISARLLKLAKIIGN